MYHKSSPISFLRFTCVTYTPSYLLLVISLLILTYLLQGYKPRYRKPLNQWKNIHMHTFTRTFVCSKLYLATLSQISTNYNCIPSNESHVANHFLSWDRVKRFPMFTEHLQIYHKLPFPHLIPWWWHISIMISTIDVVTNKANIKYWRNVHVHVVQSVVGKLNCIFTKAAMASCFARYFVSDIVFYSATLVSESVWSTDTALMLGSATKAPVKFCGNYNGKFHYIRSYMYHNINLCTTKLYP